MQSRRESRARRGDSGWRGRRDGCRYSAGFRTLCTGRRWCRCGAGRRCGARSRNQGRSGCGGCRLGRRSGLALGAAEDHQQKDGQEQAEGSHVRISRSQSQDHLTSLTRALHTGLVCRKVGAPSRKHSSIRPLPQCTIRRMCAKIFTSDEGPHRNSAAKSTGASTGWWIVPWPAPGPVTSPQHRR